MKTINSLTQDYIQNYTSQCESYECYAEREDVARAFKAGANAILDVVEEFQDLFSLNMTRTAREYLESMLEELKKK